MIWTWPYWPALSLHDFAASGFRFSLLWVLPPLWLTAMLTALAAMLATHPPSGSGAIPQIRRVRKVRMSENPRKTLGNRRRDVYGINEARTTLRGPMVAAVQVAPQAYRDDRSRGAGYWSIPKGRDTELLFRPAAEPCF
jgi:hypothetical protein